MSALFQRESKTPAIGVDLGSGFVKMAQFKEEKGSLRLVNFGILKVPEGAILEGRIEKPKEITEILKELISFHSFIGNRVVANVSGQLVTVKEIVMEDLPDNELYEAIKWEIERFLPFPLEKAVFDYQVLNEIVAQNGTKKLNVLVAAAPLDVIQLTSELLSIANLKPVALEVEPFSVLRLLRFTPGFGREENVLISAINIGHNYTSINMVDKMIVRFSRILPIGGKKITEAIAGNLGKSFEEAEETKIKQLNLGIESQVTKACLTLLNNLALEIKRSISYYFNKFNEGKSMNTVVLLEGGSANIKGIEGFIEDSVGYPTEVNRLFTSIATYDPTLFTKEYLHEMAPIFSVATGLALREYKPKVSPRKGKAATQEEQVKTFLTYKKG